MISVNFYGQPSAGKSSSAMQVASYLKNRGCNVEYVNEFAKELVYAKRLHEMANQVFMFASQYKKMDDVDRYEKVPMIITDSPILLGLVYSDHLDYFEELSALIRKIHPKYENIDVMVRRVKPYNPSGRNQTEAESDALVQKVRSLIPKFDYEIDGDEESQRKFAQFLLETYGDRIEIKK